MLRDLFSLFPAYAGVIPSDAVFIRVFVSFPRIRGGDPAALMREAMAYNFSPHTRG